MSLSTNVSNLATRVATEVKGVKTLVNGNALDLTALNTTTKTNLVAAINEILALAGAKINDATTSTTTSWSSSKTNSEIAAAVSSLVGAAPGTLDTLAELATALQNDPNQITTILSNLASKANSTDVGSTTTNYVTVFEAGLV